jgi:hypothetical protein
VINLVFWVGRDNAETLVLLDGSAVIDPTPITRVALAMADASGIDSATAPTAFSWPANVTYNGAAVKAISFTLGALAIPVGKRRVELVIYDTSHLNGLVWTDDLSIEMRA